MLFAPPPRPKAELRQGNALAPPPLGQGVALPEFGLRPRGGGHFRFFENFGKLCPMTEGGEDLNMRAPRKNFALCLKGGRFKIDIT